MFGLITIVIFQIIFFTKLLFGDIEGVVTGLMAFFGAIIGGGLTLFGVWLTLENQRKRDERERFLDSYNHKMRTVTEVKNSLKFLVNVEMQMLEFKDKFFDTYKQQLVKLRVEYVETFMDIMENELKVVEIHLDYHLYNAIEKRYRSFNFLSYLNAQLEEGLLTEESYEEHIERLYNSAKYIYNLIDDYRSELIKKYYELR